MERRLAAILAADVVGYSRLNREDEAGTTDSGWRSTHISTISMTWTASIAGKCVVMLIAGDISPRHCGLLRIFINPTESQTADITQ